MKKAALIIFQKNPVLGKVKTRLAKDIGQEAALEVYRFLLEKNHRQVRKSSVDIWVFYSDYISMDSVEEELISRVQFGQDLGERMKNAFAEVFEQGYSKVLIIGTDCPSVESKILVQAIAGLENSDLVIGPASDGGYYLLGMKKLISGLFQNIAWSTDLVFKQTQEVAEKNKLSIYFLPEFYDIDTLEDLTLFISQHPEYEYLLRPRF